MSSKNVSQKSYFELAEHNSVQVTVFLVLTIFSIMLVFTSIQPMMQSFFEGFLHGKVYNQGEVLSYSLSSPEPLKRTNFLFSWAIDMYANSAENTRYWFNPFLSLALISTVVGFGISVSISSVMPRRLGYMRQKIEREIMNEIDKIAMFTNGHHEESDYNEIISKLLNADLRDLHRYVEEWGVPLEDLKTIHKALKWRVGNPGYRIIHLNDGIRMYMRFYFTVKYSNTVLGFVYMGAAVLIIIIGLRGLKFIPPTQPSLVLFALGLEFSLLVTYAVTLMYGRQDEETDFRDNKPQGQASNYLGSDYGSSREIENLLRVFISSKKKK